MINPKHGGTRAVLNIDSLLGRSFHHATGGELYALEYINSFGKMNKLKEIFKIRFGNGVFYNL